MSDLLVVEGCTLKGENPSTVVVIVPPPFSIPSNVVKCQGFKAYHVIVFTATQGTYAGGGSLIGDSSKVHSQGLSFVRSSQTADIDMVNGSSPYDTISETISVDTAGQDKVGIE